MSPNAIVQVWENRLRRINNAVEFLRKAQTEYLAAAADTAATEPAVVHSFEMLGRAVEWDKNHTQRVLDSAIAMAEGD